MRSKMLQVAAVSAASLVLAACGSPSPGSSSATTLGPAASVTSLPPATPTALAKLVAASTTIHALSSTVLQELNQHEPYYAPSDWWVNVYVGAATCLTYGACVLGDTRAARTVVLFGDSHAAMWLPAVVPAVARAGFRLVVLYNDGCDFAALPPNNRDPNPAQCDRFRSAAVAAIRKARPALVILGEKTSDVTTLGSARAFTTAKWQSFDARAIRQLATASTKVALIEDVPWMGSNPPVCVAAYPAQVQRCADPFPDPSNPGQQVAEQRAAAATGATFIKTSAWLCARRCSPVVGDFITHVDPGHITELYAAFLAAVMGDSLAPLLS